MIYGKTTDFLPRKTAFVVLFFILFCVSSFAGEDITHSWRIAGLGRPLGIGDIVYEGVLGYADGHYYGNYNIALRYVGFDESGVRLSFKYSADDYLTEPFKQAVSGHMSVPFDQNEQAYVKIDQLPRLPRKVIASPTGLVINWYDRSRGLINVTRVQDAPAVPVVDDRVLR